MVMCRDLSADTDREFVAAKSTGNRCDIYNAGNFVRLNVSETAALKRLAFRRLEWIVIGVVAAI